MKIKLTFINAWIGYNISNSAVWYSMGDYEQWDSGAYFNWILKNPKHWCIIFKPFSFCFICWWKMETEIVFRCALKSLAKPRSKWWIRSRLNGFRFTMIYKWNSQISMIHIVNFSNVWQVQHCFKYCSVNC